MLLVVLLVGAADNTVKFGFLNFSYLLSLLPASRLASGLLLILPPLTLSYFGFPPLASVYYASEGL